MITLAVETCLNGYSIALANDANLLGEFKEREGQTQAKNLVKSISELLSKTGFSYKNLNKIVVCVGPGSFTGIRIGIAAVQGIRLVTNCEVFMLNSFEIVAGKSIGRDICVKIPAGRGRFYVQNFNNLAAVSEAKLLEEYEIALYANEHLIVESEFNAADMLNLMPRLELKPAKHLSPMYIAEVAYRVNPS